MKKPIALALLAMAVQAHAEPKEVKLPTAADGEVSFFLDNDTRMPLGVSDDKTMLTTAALALLPVQKGRYFQWTFTYALQFKPDVKVASVTIEDEQPGRLATLAQDDTPRLKDGVWLGMEKPQPFTMDMYKNFYAKDPWVLQRRITVRYADGSQSKLHQLVLQTQAMRISLYNSALSTLKPPLKDTPVPELDSRTWKLGYDKSNFDQSIAEFVLPDQTVENWKELFTRQEFFDPDSRLNLRKVSDRIHEALAAKCATLDWKVLKESDREIMYQWSGTGCANDPPQFELARLSRVQSVVCRWAYASKQPPVAEAYRDLVQTRIDSLSCD